MEEKQPLTRTGEGVARLTAKLQEMTAAKKRPVPAEEVAAPTPAAPVEPEQPEELEQPERPEQPEAEEPKAALSPSMELEAERLEAERLAAAEAARIEAARAEHERILAEEREAEEREATEREAAEREAEAEVRTDEAEADDDPEPEETEEPQAPPPAKKRWTFSQWGWIVIFTLCVIAIAWVATQQDRRHPSAAERAAEAARSAIARVLAHTPSAPSPAVSLPTPTAASPVFTGPSGWTVCMPAKAFAPAGCANVQSVLVSGLHADWSRPVYNCEYGQARGNNLCNCRVCERIP